MHRQTASPRARARSRILVSLVAAMLAAMTLAAGAVPVGAASPKSDKLGKIDHIVVIYEENHSFDNLYGGWEGVNGLANADVAHTTQVAQNGTPYACLKQNDANLTSPPLAADACSVANGDAFDSHFPNTYFSIDQYIPSTAITCPPTLQAFSFPNGLRDPGINPATGLPVPGATAGGCTRDIVHRFYHEQYQLDGGKQDRYVTGSDAIGLTMGVYDTQGAADLQVPPRGRPSEVRDRRQLLPGGIRRLVPESPVADRGRLAGRPERRHDRRRSASDARRQRDALE